MLIDNINLNQLRVFGSVYRTKSMTLAARELYITQSGVSQHIKALEDVLKVKLFDRYNRKLVPTRAAIELYRGCQNSLIAIEQSLSKINRGEETLSGTVSIGMPIEFGNSLIIPHLQKFSQKNPAVDFIFRVGFASEMNEAILQGELDFAFVDTFHLDSKIESNKVFEEKLLLCATKDYVHSKKLKSLTVDSLAKMEFIAYQPDQPVLRLWFQQNLRLRKFKLNVRATIMDVQGVSRLIVHHMGVGVLPEYVVKKMQASGIKLHVFKGSSKGARNSISVAYLKNKTWLPAAEAAKDYLLSKL